MKIPLVDLKAQYQSIKAETDSAIQKVIDSGQFILGPEVSAFEQEVAAYCGTKHAVGVASGTDALLLALLGCGIAPGDEVITTPFTFIATAEAIVRCGATPVFADIDPLTYNLDPARTAARITRRTKAILPVHLYGHPAQMDAIMEMAERHRLLVIEDCAQALGAESGGKKVGSMGDAGCLSFFPSKALGAYGDGGMVITNDDEIASKVSLLRKHGASGSYLYNLHGFNSRLDALQAAVLRVKLPHLEGWNAAREGNAVRYRHLFQAAGLASGPDAPLVLPEPRPGARHTYHQYVIRARRRDELMTHLRSAGIGCAIYYPIPLHLQRCFAGLRHHPGDFPVSETAAASTLALPIYPELTGAMQEEVVGVIRNFYTR